MSDFAITTTPERISDTRFTIRTDREPEGWWISTTKKSKAVAPNLIAVRSPEPSNVDLLREIHVLLTERIASQRSQLSVHEDLGATENGRLSLGFVHEGREIFLVVKDQAESSVDGALGQGDLDAARREIRAGLQEALAPFRQLLESMERSMRKATETKEHLQRKRVAVR